MRMPWVPRFQSSGCVQGVNFVRRVTAQEREGSSWEVMGGKRVSSKALLGVLFEVGKGRGGG